MLCLVNLQRGLEQKEGLSTNDARLGSHGRPSRLALDERPRETGHGARLLHARVAKRRLLEEREGGLRPGMGSRRA